jgi:hypothetical protein
MSPSGIFVSLQPVAVIPDSTPAAPARISVVTQDPSGRLLANDQRGPLYSFSESNGAVSKYLDLRDYPELAIVSTPEKGFQSFAFHPDFYASNQLGFGRFYTLHTTSNITVPPDTDPGGPTDSHTLLLEWRTGNPGSATFAPANPAVPYRLMFRLKQPFGNHNGGLIAFNPTSPPGDADYGNLYIALGDGGAGGDILEMAQNPSTPYGAILRINPLGADGLQGRYGIVRSNALAQDGSASTLAEIYCFGLRNPQRFGWDAQTRRMFIADIGQGAVEEINLAVNGANYGWDTREGSFSFEPGLEVGLTNPVAEYDHTNPVSVLPTPIGNRAVTLGEVVRGSPIFALNGKLLAGDIPTGVMFVLDVDRDPLNGGQDGLFELGLVDGSGAVVSFLDVINRARSDRGLGAVNRADIRFSVNTGGRIFVSNKHDGIVRRMIAAAPPANWAAIYSMLFADPADVELFRQYRDVILSRNEIGRTGVRRIYADRELWLGMLREHRDLVAKASTLAARHRDAIAAAVRGETGIITDSSAIVQFLAEVESSAPAEMRDSARAARIAIEWMRRSGVVFGGLRLQ